MPHKLTQTSRPRRAAASVTRFLRDDRGSVVIDFLPVFAAVFAIVVFIIEVGIGFYLNVAAQKAAQIGARAAVTHNPVHSGVPDVNRLFYANGRLGDACYQDSGADACLDPGGPWVCDGSGLAAECNPIVFNRIVRDMRRADANMAPDRVRVTYVYRRLGYAGGPFVPEVRVDVAHRHFGLFGPIFGMISFLAYDGEDGVMLGRATSSAYGEDLNSNS